LDAKNVKTDIFVIIKENIQEISRQESIKENSQEISRQESIKKK
jgi:hypothetical protein